ncbi:MAG: AMP-binding protein [Acidobacteriota bacterium]|nr:AMP-binding protein [Acidobacteriota bacterium]
MLARRAEANPDSLFVRFVKQGNVVGAYTYSQTWTWVTQWAWTLIGRGVRKGDRVVLALPNSDDFVGAYLGALLCGGIPAPIAPFRDNAPADYDVSLVSQRIRLLDAKVLVVPEEQANMAALSRLSDINHLTIISRRDLEPAIRHIPPDGSEADIALLQFTSGTTGNAKVVRLSHGALLAQTRNVSEHLKLEDPSVDWAVSWLPLFYDMGLIGFLLTPIYPGGHVTLLRTEDFILRPSLWVKALSQFRASITGGPPSAYALCARFTRDSEVERCELGRVRVALVGAEAISPESLQQFVDKFRPAGFRATSLLPTYGLAEAGSAVTMTSLDQGTDFDLINLESMGATRIARSAGGGNPPNCPTRPVASLGPPIPQMEVAIFSEAGERLPERRIGEVVVRGPSLIQGYYAQPEASRQALQDGGLWTGDLGYLADGKLYITGRKQELITLGGRNHHPEDLEQVVRERLGVRGGRVVAIGCEGPERGSEAAVVLVETALTAPAERNALRQQVLHDLLGAGYTVSQVVLLPPKTIRNTPNGKLRRVDCKARYLAGEFSADH